MDDKAIDFKVAVGVWAGAADRGEHLADEVLRDFQAGRLEPVEKDRVLDHVARCRDCLDLVNDLRAFSAAALPRAETAAADFEAAAFWRTLRPRLEREPPETLEVAAVARPARSGGGWRTPALLAAALAVAALGITSLQQSRTISELRRPRANVEVYDLYLDTSERSGTGPAPERVLSPSAGVIVFTPRDPGSHADYEVAIVDPGGGRVWAARGFVADPDDGSFSLWLPPGFLSAGEYAVRLSGIDGGDSELIEEYALHVER
jgi:hypothetical protein